MAGSDQGGVVNSHFHSLTIIIIVFHKKLFAKVLIHVKSLKIILPSTNFASFEYCGLIKSGFISFEYNFEENFGCRFCERVLI